MSPEDKATLIESLKNKHNKIICMVGDGANDCKALKTADIGLSLSQAEASIASPFISPKLESVGLLLKEGRCAISTSFMCFKYMTLYSMI